MAYRVNTESHGDRTVYTLHDDATGASAAVLPSYGFNLFSLQLPAGGAVREVLESAPDFAENPTSPARQRDADPVPVPEPDQRTAGITSGARNTGPGRPTARTRSTASP